MQKSVSRYCRTWRLQQGSLVAPRGRSRTTVPPPLQRVNKTRDLSRNRRQRVWNERWTSTKYLCVVSILLIQIIRWLQLELWRWTSCVLPDLQTHIITMQNRDQSRRFKQRKVSLSLDYFSSIFLYFKTSLLTHFLNCLKRLLIKITGINQQIFEVGI